MSIIMVRIGNNIEQTNRRVVDRHVGQDLADRHGMCVIETSSVNNINVQSALQVMADGIMDAMGGGKCTRCNHELAATRLESNQLQKHRLYRVKLTWVLCRRFSGRGCPGDRLVELIQELPIIESLDITMIPVPLDHELGSTAVAD